jgi:hypothetical protein
MLFGVSLIFISFTLFFLASCQSSQLPEINIEVLDDIKFDKKAPCILTINDSQNNKPILSKIESRGGISRKYLKKSFEVKFSNQVSLVGLPLNTSFIFNASYIDKTFMRHKICYALFNEMSTNNKAPQCRYVNLSVNNIYNGLYVLMEAINADFLDLNKNDSLAMLFKDPPIFIHEKIDHVEDKSNYYQQKYPKKSKSDKTYYIENFKLFLFESDDYKFAKNIEKWIDIENVTDWHLLLLLTNNGDGVLKNFYLYKKNSSTPFRIAIWDFDHSFGRDGDNELNNTSPDIAFERSILLKRLFNNPHLNYRNKLKSRWEYLRKKGILSSNKFKRHIALNSKIIGNELKNNFDKWPLDGEYYFDKNSHEKEVDIMIKFVDMNLTILDEYFKTL